MHSAKIAAAVLLSACAAAGCSTVRHYDANLPVNFSVDSNTDDVEATLNIFRADAQCRTDYLGTVELEGEHLELGIASGQPAYLVVGFSHSSFWGGTSGFTRYEVVLIPREPYAYRMDVSYVDNIYNVELFEIDRATGGERLMRDEELQACRG